MLIAAEKSGGLVEAAAEVSSDRKHDFGRTASWDLAAIPGVLQFVAARVRPPCDRAD
jgi:hypothetical protein